jgi:tRNA (cmo5U34)-methyltransferase
MSGFEWNPETYLDEMLDEIPGYEELQDAVAAATDGVAARDVLELGTGTGETAVRLLARHPGARWTGIDASEAMLARAWDRLPEAVLLLSRLEDPLPEGPFDLVVSTLASITTTDRASGICSHAWRACSGRADGSCSATSSSRARVRRARSRSTG